MVRNVKNKTKSPSVVPEVIISTQQDEGIEGDHVTTISREPSRERSSRSVSISRLKIGDPLRKEMMFVREKSPFEIGENRNVQVASTKAIIDKALIMDVSGGITKVDEYVSLFFSPGCVIDAAVCEDISTQQIEVIVLEEEEEKPEIVIKPLTLHDIKEIPDEPSQIQSENIETTEEHGQNSSIVSQLANDMSGIEEKQDADMSGIEEKRDVPDVSDTIINNESLQQSVEAVVTAEINLEESIPSVNEQNGENQEENEPEEEEIESSSDETFDDPVDSSLWKSYNSDDDDATAWFYKKPEVPEYKPTEKEKDDEFRKERLAKRIPVFLTKLTDRAGHIGSEVKLQCSIEGHEASIKWMKNDQVIEGSSRVRKLALDGLYSLTIKKLKKKDEAIYTIFAKNRGGEISSCAKVKVYEDLKETIELPTMIKIRDYYHHALNDLIIECQIMSKPTWHVPDVMWLKNEDPIILDKRIRATYEGNEIFQLNIYDPTPEDSGIYACIARNTAGERIITHEVEFTSKVHYIRLPGMRHADRKILTEEEMLEKQLQASKKTEQAAALRGSSRSQAQPEPYKEESYVIRDSKNKLTWAGQLNNITAQKGQTVKMICSVNGGEQAILKWHKNNKAIDYDNRVRLLNSGVIGQITINDVLPKDAGEYVCTAKNNYNEIKTFCTLKVIELPSAGSGSTPMFTKAIKEFFDSRTRDLVLETQVHGEPIPNIQWYKDDESITYNDKLMLNREPNGKYQLRIHKPQSEDCGMYECRAMNSNGQAKVKHEVKFNSNEAFVHAHRAEHTDRFKRHGVDDSNVTLPGDEQQRQSQVKELENIAEPANPALTSVPLDESEVSQLEPVPVNVLEKKVLDEPKPKPIPRHRPAMPRRRFDEGPSEPFIIRDSKKKLTWETKLKNLMTTEGKAIKMVCIVAGPQPQFKWIKNGKPLVWSKNVVNATLEGFGCIKIKNVTVDDAGEYTAQAKNADSDLECSCKLTVFSIAEDIETIPTFTRVADYYDIRTDDLVLEIQVRGIPQPTVEWERDGRKITDDTERVIIAREKDGVYKLSIHDPVKLDGGQWVIKASNSAGEKQIRHHVIFRGKEHVQYLPGIYHADSKTIRGENDEVGLPRINRSISRASSIMSFRSDIVEPSSTITQETLTEMLDQNIPTEEMEETHAVQKTSKNPKKREWQKKLSALYNTDTSSAKVELLKPKPIEAKQKLSFEAQLKNITVAEGNPVRLVCSCIGPSPTFKWFRNNIPIVWSKTLKNENKLGVGAISFKSTVEADSGVYKCVASNNFGEIESSCTLKVFSPLRDEYEEPKFTRKVREYYNASVNDLILEFQVRGNPPPTIKWFRDGVAIEDTEGDKFFQMREPNGIHKLTIHDPQRTDEGRYVIEAENIKGKDILKHEVKKLNKEAFTHVYGIMYHDPNVMKHGTYEEPEVERTVRRPPRECVFLEDGSYYLRGDTPEYLWEWETDTSAESEYEPYVPTSADEIEDDKTDVESVEEEEEEEKEEDGQKNESLQDENEEETAEEYQPETQIEKPKLVEKRGPKIKKMRKKRTYVTSELDDLKQKEAYAISELDNLKQKEACEDTKTANIAISAEELKPDEPLQPVKVLTDFDKEVLRKERYLRLFPELVPEPEKPKQDKNALKFITELRDITATEGTAIKLFCTVLGPKPDIKWQKNGQPLEFDKRRVRNQNQDNTGIVNITKILPSDEGVYKVVVKYKDNIITSQANVTVMKKTEVQQGMPPRFITGIDQHYDFRVNDLILETHIKGDGLLKVQWFLDGIEIPNNEKYIQIREPMGVHKLCIHDPQIRDKGKYRIKVTNDYGTEELEYYLTLEGKQEKQCYGIFHADPRRQYKDEDTEKLPRKYREVVFHDDGSYYVRGQTPEQYWEWETDTSAESEYEELPESEKEESVEDDDDDDDDEKRGDSSEAEENKGADKEGDDVQQLTNQDATNEMEEVDTSEIEPIDVQPKMIRRGPKIKKMRKKVTKPTPAVESLEPKSITKLSTEISENQRKPRLSQRIITDQPIEPEQKTTSKKKIIDVEFISRLRNQTLLKGKTLSLNCCCSDNQKIEVNWYKDGQKFQMNKRCVSDIHFGFITLEIYRTVLEDSGTYECHVKTANGEAKDTCNIVVFELPDKDTVELVPPTFIHPLKEIYHPRTNDLHLETRVRGNPVPTFQWIYDGYVYIDHSTDKYEVFNQHYYELGTKVTAVTLIINDPQLKDSGKYTLVAKNEVQTVEISRKVKIDLRPEALKKKRMDDVVIENDAPRIMPKAPTPEPEPEPEPEQLNSIQNDDEAVNPEQTEDTEEDEDDWLNV